MKIILSRKGFDSENGGMPSPILPDGTLLSMPIPAGSVNTKYSDLKYTNKTYFEIAQELQPRFSHAYCHLDPDIREKVISRSANWESLFGQCGAAQGHLIKHSIKVGDIFLFFGWFKQTELGRTGKLQFVRNAPDLNIIYGYMQIGEIVSDNKRIRNEFYWHPHSDDGHINTVNNNIYAASDKLSFDNSLSGYGTFNLNNKRILTKLGMTRTKWDLPEFFRNVNITYHTQNSFKENYFQSVARGQEFVIYANDEIINWAMDIIKS